MELTRIKVTKIEMINYSLRNNVGYEPSSNLIAKSNNVLDVEGVLPNEKLH